MLMSSPEDDDQGYPYDFNMRGFRYFGGTAIKRLLADAIVILFAKKTKVKLLQSSRIEAFHLRQSALQIAPLNCVNISSGNIYIGVII